MSLYQVQKVLFDTNNQSAAAEHMQRDLPGFLDKYDLQPAERAAFLAGDVGRLYAMGVHPLLLAPYGARLGLTWQNHLQAMQQGTLSIDGDTA